MKNRRKIEENLSPLQARMLAAMPTGREVTSTDLIDLIYGVDPPYNARGSFLSTMAVLIRKLDHMGDGWRIVKGPRIGPRPITFKLERGK